MCGNRRADLRQRQGWRSLNDAFWSAVPISARIISKQAWVEEKMETEASFLVNQTRSFCVRSPMSRLLKALIAETEAQERLITGPLGAIPVLLAARGHAWLRDLIRGLELEGAGWGFPFLSLSVIYPGFLSGSPPLQKGDWRACLYYTTEAEGTFSVVFRNKHWRQPVRQVLRSKKCVQGCVWVGGWKETWALTGCLLFLSFQAAVPIVLTKTFFSPKCKSWSSRNNPPLAL